MGYLREGGAEEIEKIYRKRMAVHNGCSEKDSKRPRVCLKVQKALVC